MSLKVDAVETRTMLLFNQGCYWYRAIPNVREDRLVVLMTTFGEIVTNHAASHEIFGLI
jgi:hypothetical protein